MTDTESEAALLALASVLIWHPFELEEVAGQTGPTTTEVAAAGTTIYGVQQFAGFCRASATGTTTSQVRAANLPDAKAACERHYATGKWE